MANRTTKEVQERREKLKVLWAGGMRTMSKIAQALSCSVGTVKRDLVILRREARRAVKTDRLIDIVRMEEDQGLLQDIEQVNILIQNFKTSPDVVSGLIRSKLMARRQRAELWGLIGTAKTGISVNVKAEANANTGNAEELEQHESEMRSVLSRYLQD